MVAPLRAGSMSSSGGGISRGGAGRASMGVQNTHTVSNRQNNVQQNTMIEIMGTWKLTSVPPTRTPCAYLLSLPPDLSCTFCRFCLTSLPPDLFSRRYVGNCVIKGEAGDELVEEAAQTIASNPFDSHNVCFCIYPCLFFK